MTARREMKLRYWKKLKRHPLGAEYPDISGPAWQRFVADVEEFGVINKRRVTLHEGMVLDGWQLYRACVEANVKPEFQRLPNGITAERFVDIVNDNRRHETQEVAVARSVARRKRVADARAAGKSTRDIAQDLGLSQSTVVRDLAAERDPGDDTDAIAEDEAKEKAQPKPGKPKYDRKEFDSAWGKLLREIDKIGNAYGCKDTPEAAALRRLLGEWKVQVTAWLHKVSNWKRNRPERVKPGKP